MTREEVQTFTPRLAPRDATDAALAIAVGLLQCAVLFLLPVLLVDALFVNGWWWGIGTSVALYVIFLLHVVKDVKVGSDGIRFTRTLGNPKFLRWSEITEVVEASRSELVIHGWLWPLFLPREMSPSCTTLGHCRIGFGKGFVYFPPSDLEGFMAAIDRFSRPLPLTKTDLVRDC